jgi:hypothetical protein
MWYEYGILKTYCIPRRIYIYSDGSTRLWSWLVGRYFIFQWIGRVEYIPWSSETAVHWGQYQNLHSPEPEFFNIYRRLKRRRFEESCLFKGQSVQQGSQWQQFFVLYFKDFSVLTVWTKKKLDRMTLHLHFTLEISADLFGSLKIKLSAQPSFENSGSALKYITS